MTKSGVYLVLTEQFEVIFTGIKYSHLFLQDASILWNVAYTYFQS